jgi:2-oxoglutarate ferredoxin oxidoreductase subunit alpha
LARTLPRPTLYGPPEGNVLLVSWGSSQGPIREAVEKARAAGESVSAMHLRYLMPLQPGIQEILDGVHHVFVVELNDEGLYGFGQLAALLRARFCDPKIRGINKTDGVPFKVREILDEMHRQLQKLEPKGSLENV